MFDFINLFFTQVHWNDLFDIVLVTLLIYKALSIMRSTKATKVVLGLLSLFILFLFSITFHFQALNWLLSKFFDSIFIIVIVLFQDQIRHGLGSFFKRSGSLGGIKKNKFHYEIEEIIEAVKKLREKKLGTIIAFENGQSLSNYSVKGTHIDAPINSDILLSFASTDSPLHDGAVIIGKGRILAAGIFLPLTKSGDEEKFYGSRHRAALGLVEVTDSVVLTVSEETGDIRVFHKGKCLLCKDTEHLRSSLFKFWLGKNGQTRKELVLE